MQTNFAKSLELVLVHEGGWSDNPQDPGGATMKGVTLAVYRNYYGADKSKEDLRNISDDELQHIYKTGYWDKCRCDELPIGLDYAVFDAAVNSGPGRSTKWLQAAVGVTQDGAIGPGTLAAVAAQDTVELIIKVTDRRLAFLQQLSTWPTFGKGWERRVQNVRQQALAMANGTEPLAEEVNQSTAAVPQYQVVAKGSTGEWVVKVQKEIGEPADGIFGEQTEAALKAWQQEHDLTPDGIAGLDTYHAMGLIA